MKIAGKEINLTTQVFIAMILGAAFGIIVGKPMTQVGFIGKIWLNCITLAIIPMVLVLIINGICAQKDMKTLGRLSLKIVGFYVGSTLVASAVGIAVASLVKPGVIANITGLASRKVASGTVDVTVAGFFTSMFTTNMFKSFTEGNILQTVIVAVLIGLAIVRIKDADAKATINNAFKVLNDIVYSLIGMIMLVSPIGIFFLMADSFGQYGIGIFTSMATLAGTYYLACLIQIIVVYGGAVWLLAGINPIKFLINSAELWLYTISTCSSVAAIPVSLKVAKEKFKVPDYIANFSLPLGSQLGYDGSVILYACVIVFISQVAGIPLSLGTMFNIVILSAIFSTGGAGIPASGIVKLMIMVTTFGLPTEIVGIIAAFYRLFDMGTTTLNALGDLAWTVCVSKLEGKNVKNLPLTETE